MSLKDLLGLFDKKTNQSDNLNVSLQQGANFNSMQSRIGSSVEPRLALIEQTTEQGIGSIIENFSGNSNEAPLAKVNTVEYKELQQLEDNFNKAVSEYTRKQNAIMSESKVPPAESCQGWSCEINGQFCPADRPGSSGAGVCCRNGKWEQGACDKQSAAGNKNIMDSMFKALQAKTTELQQKTMSFHGQQKQLTGPDGQLTQQKSATLQQLTELQSQQSRLNKLISEGDTLSASIHDNTLQMNAAYMRYFVWLGAAITLGLVAMHRASK
uniref:Uncharacterized protein n=1 Tax=viral metagenome TaxID=1070528 RepID=A0A6C0EMK0_9ZZZZ